MVFKGFGFSPSWLFPAMSSNVVDKFELLLMVRLGCDLLILANA